MRMAVDQAGDQDLLWQLDTLGLRVAGQQFGARADGGDAVGIDQQRMVLEHVLAGLHRQQPAGQQQRLGHGVLLVESVSGQADASAASTSAR